MRKLTELYQIAYDKIKDAQDDEYQGLCQFLSTLYDNGDITFKEETRLRRHIYANKPCEHRHIEFIADCSYNDQSSYWWPYGKLEQRKLFLKKMIQVSKPWYKQIGYIWENLKSIAKL